MTPPRLFPARCCCRVGSVAGWGSGPSFALSCWVGVRPVFRVGAGSGPPSTVEGARGDLSASRAFCSVSGVRLVEFGARRRVRQCSLEVTSLFSPRSPEQSLSGPPAGLETLVGRFRTLTEMREKYRRRGSDRGPVRIRGIPRIRDGSMLQPGSRSAAEVT